LSFSNASLWRGGLESATGALIEAEADARLAFDTNPAPETVDTPWLYGLLAQVLAERGALDEASQTLARYEAEVGPLRADSWSHAGLFRSRARLAAMRGARQRAPADALAAGRLAARIKITNPAVDFGLSWQSEAALAHHRLGDSAAAGKLAREQVALARTWGA